MVYRYNNEIKFAFFFKSILFYLAWPDQSCPDIAQPLIELVKNVEKSRTELTNMNKHSGPVVVHCRYTFSILRKKKLLAQSPRD